MRMQVIPAVACAVAFAFCACAPGPTPSLRAESASLADLPALAALAARITRTTWAGGGAPPRPEQGAKGPGVVVRFLTEGLKERGCLSYYRGVSDFEAAAASAAWEAGFNDPRYPPLEPVEASDLLIEVGTFGDWTRLRELGGFDYRNRALLMLHPEGSVLMQPTVVADRDWDLEALLEALCRKEGLPPGSWKDPGTVFLSAPFSAYRVGFEDAERSSK